MRRFLGDSIAVLAGLVFGCVIIVGAAWALVSVIQHQARKEAAAPTLTADQTRDRMDTLLRDAVARMGPGISLTRAKAEAVSWDCTGDSEGNDSPTGKVIVSLDYLLDGATREKQPDVIRAMGTVGPTHEERDYFQTATVPDRRGATRYVFALKRVSDDQMSILARSGCVWPHGTSAPTPN